MPDPGRRTRPQPEGSSRATWDAPQLPDLLEKPAAPPRAGSAAAEGAATQPLHLQLPRPAAERGQEEFGRVQKLEQTQAWNTGRENKTSLIILY